MRILYIVQQFGGPSGNWGSRPFEQSTRLAQKYGHQVTVLCGRFDRASDADVEAARATGVEVIQAPILLAQRQSYPRRIWTYARFMRWAQSTAKHLPRPDVILASSPPLTVGNMAAKVARYHQIPFVFEVRDLWPELPEAVGALNHPILKLAARRMAHRVYEAADHVVALSDGMKERIPLWGVDPRRITVVSNASDNGLFGGREQRDAIRTRMGWDKQFVCLYPGSMGFMNGLDYCLDCAKILDARGITDIHLALMGDGARREHLAARIRDEGIRSAALYDAVTKRDMPGYLSAADIGISCFLPIPPMEANSANKYFDFLSAGLPVVINYGGWQATALRETGAGVSVDGHRPEAMADAIVRLQNDPEARAEMGRRARRLAQERYDRDLLVDRLEHVLRTTSRHQEDDRFLHESLEWRPMVWAPAARAAFTMGASWLVPGARVLEIGYGSGRMAAYLAATFGVHVTGYDVHPDNALRATANAARLGMTDRTTFRTCRPDETTSIQGPYDAVFVKSVLYHIANPAQYREWLAWIHRVLRPGGALIALENGRGNGLTRFYRRRVSPRNYHDYCLIDAARLDDFRAVFATVEARHFGRYSQFFTGWVPAFRLITRLETALCPPDADGHFVSAILATRAPEDR